MKKIILSALLVASTLTPVAVPASHAQSPLICLAYDAGGPGDDSFNDAAQAGLKVALSKLQFALETTVTSGEAKDRKERLVALVKKDCLIVIAVGSGYAPTLKELSQEYPETQFAILNDATVDALNVTSIVFADVQGAYLAGFSAALASKSGRVAMIGSASEKALFDKGFLPGAKAAKKSIIATHRTVTGAATTVTAGLLRSGHDVIYLATTGSATDVFSVIAASNRGGKTRVPARLITQEPDQFLAVDAASKRFLLATVVKRVDLALIDLVTVTLAGSTLYDAVDPALGVYGHRYGISDKSIEITLRSPALIAARSKINAASVAASKLSS
jgi:basic membrane protein A and related proteins